jgi:hypothetical protein
MNRHIITIPRFRLEVLLFILFMMSRKCVGFSPISHVPNLSCQSTLPNLLPGKSHQHIFSRMSRVHKMNLKMSATTVPKVSEDYEEPPLQYVRGGGLLWKDVGRWPSLDAVDARLIKIGVPCILNFAIVPLVGAVDLFWVNQMGNPLAVAGQSAANQVFNSVFWLASFLPSGK